MLKLLIEKLLCKHDWEEKYKIPTYNKGLSLSAPVSIYVTLFCKNCGKIKQIKI